MSLKTEAMKSIPKFKLVMNPKSYRMAHPIYKIQDIEQITKYHHKPQTLGDKFAKGLIGIFRGGFDTFTRYNPETMREREWLFRMIILETVAGVPGMVGGLQRHLRSLRTMEHDHGWITHLLQEAENERMHLFFFLSMRNPGIAMRSIITAAQLIFYNFFFAFYLVSPKTAHRFVGYLEEEAVHTYTVAIDCVDKGRLPVWANM